MAGEGGLSQLYLGALPLTSSRVQVSKQGTLPGQVWGIDPPGRRSARAHAVLSAKAVLRLPFEPHRDQPCPFLITHLPPSPKLEHVGHLAQAIDGERVGFYRVVAQR